MSVSTEEEPADWRFFADRDPDIKEHYYYSHPQNNPKRIVPLGPKLDIEPLEENGTKRKAGEAEGASKKVK